MLLERIKEVGSKKWLQEQQELYKCPKCGGEISMHDAECFDCGLKIDPNRFPQAMSIPLRCKNRF